MRWLCLVAAFSAALFAQTAAPNEAGVSLGHIHLIVANPEAQKKVWVDALGATASKAGMLDLYKLPGIFIIVSGPRGGAAPTEGSNGSSVNHIGFLVKDYAAIHKKLAEAGCTFTLDNEKNKQMIAVLPDKVSVEFNEDTTIKSAVEMHHIHLSVPDQEAERTWYVKTFGGMNGSRRNSPAAMIPGGEVDYLKAATPAAPTKGRSLDHIGFEVKNLDAFAKLLEAQGIKLDQPVRDLTKEIGLKYAFITDPVGTYIELTEGLSAK